MASWGRILFLALALLWAAPVAAGPGPRDIMDAKEVLVAAIGNWGGHNRLAWQGVALAVEEINRSGGILGKPVRLWRNDVPGEARQAIKQARDIADDPATALAVLDSSRGVALPMSTVLAFHGIPTFLTGESTPFTEVNLPHLFRLSPSDTDEMRYLAAFCIRKGLRRITIIVAHGDTATLAANTFETEARAMGLEVALRLECERDASEGELRQVLAGVNNDHTFDALFYAGPASQALKLLRAAAAQGIEKPFIGGSQWDTPELALATGLQRASVYLATPFAPDRKAKRFSTAYRQAYGESPDIQAAVNYNALLLYAQAARLSGSANPDRVMGTLYGAFHWDGPFGPVRINKHGAIIFPRLYIKHFTKGGVGLITFAAPNLEHWH
jgi:branched-chain amino acid transport system substrate-binding protein